ncbi:MAG: MBL fold metallo-hydrolase [Chlorobiaceae bacterium]|nr:MBL fold metallo-hydrolase [Chlorobiaceae bacterium]
MATLDHHENCGCPHAERYTAVGLSASTKTGSSNQEWITKLPFSDTRDFKNATRGFLGTLEDGIIRQENGAVVWDLGEYGFLSDETAPDTVNPSLWRQARLNRINGLFQVVDRIYQVRGLDIANITFIEGDTGLIIIDALTTVESAKAALELYYRYRPRKPINTIIYTHSHADHFGGVRGLVSEEQVRSGEVRIVAPAGFVEETVSENVLAGPAMARRSLYQFGQVLPIGPKGTIDAGLGKASRGGIISLIAPTQLIAEELETHSFDGVEIVFQLTPETEAPAELHLYLPQWKALNLAENATHTQHNLLPLRGAKVRDAKAWAEYLNAALEKFGREAEVVFAQHHWPIWENGNIVDYLGKQRDIYKHLHDQTLKLANQGYTAPEIAEIITLPEELEQEWSVRGLYGAVKHNVKAIYQRYLGWYDGNPANLDPLTPTDSARKWIDYAGGSVAVLQRAAKDYELGEYRWVAEVLGKLVYAEPHNQEALELLASAFEQLGYQSESATWRNAYLQGANELRRGQPAQLPLAKSFDLQRALDAGNLFDALAIRLNAGRAAGKRITINWYFTDLEQDHLLTLERSTINHIAGYRADKPDATVRLSQDAFRALLLKESDFMRSWRAGLIKIKGNPLKLVEFFSLLDEVDPSFPIVTPRPSIQQEASTQRHLRSLASGIAEKLASVFRSDPDGGN